jgi:hypothetical protein
MNRVEWTEIAKSLAEQRAELVAKWPPRVVNIDASARHDRKLIYFATLDGFDRAARAVCRCLKRRSSRFDSKKFLELVGIPK